MWSVSDDRSTVAISHLDVAPTVPDVAAETQVAVKDLQQKTPVTPAVEPIISLRVFPKSKLEMIVQSSVMNKYNIIVTHYLKRIVALLDRIFSFRNQNFDESPTDVDETSSVNR